MSPESTGSLKIQRVALLPMQMTGYIARQQAPAPSGVEQIEHR
jgi:hypothetical protein